jgi:hypothetical protein
MGYEIGLHGSAYGSSQEYIRSGRLRVRVSDPEAMARRMAARSD